MFSLFIGAAIVGGVVGLFFLRAKRKPQARPKKATSGSNSRTSGRIADKGKAAAHHQGKRFIVKANDLLTGFLSLERDAMASKDANGNATR